MFSTPFPQAFGIDISDLSIKIVQLVNISHRRQRASYELHDYRSVALPPGLIVNGIIEQPEKVRSFIVQLLQAKKGLRRAIKSKWCVATIPEPQSFIKLISVPRSSDTIVDANIIEIAKKHVPFDESDSFIDWQIIPSATDEKKMSVLISAAPQTVVRSYTYLLESCGLGIIALEPESLALARSMITAKKVYEQEARAVLDIGATKTSLLIYDNSMVQFTISLPYSGEIVTTALAQRLHISREEAEEKKCQYGLAFHKKNTDGKRAWSVVADMTNVLIVEIQKAIRFYYSHFSDAHKITKITMCGGAANMKLLDKVLSTKLHIPCTLGHPWKNLHNKKKIDMTEQGAVSYATSIGLALRAADNPFFKRDMI